MNWYHWLALVSLAICLSSLLYHLITLIRLGNPADYAEPAGSASAGVRYSFTGAMSPKKKESAYLHLPTYTAGLLYHGGTFLCIFIFILSFFPFFIEWIGVQALLGWIITGVLLLTSLSGLFILIKRFSKSMMRKLSNADDYISNILVTAFQAACLIYIISLLSMGGSLDPPVQPMMIVASILLLYMPLGKLKHLVYFFAARYHLGLFYGIRGTWPPKTMKNEQ